MQKYNTIIDPQSIDINWKTELDNSDFAEAYEYLKLIFLPDDAMGMVNWLEDNPETVNVSTNNIVRAAGLNGPTMITKEIQAITRQINTGKVLTPPIIIPSPKQERIHIASGYDTICALYFKDSTLSIPCITTAWNFG
jgi:hypothetical protein